MFHKGYFPLNRVKGSFFCVNVNENSIFFFLLSVQNLNVVTTCEFSICYKIIKLSSDFLTRFKFVSLNPVHGEVYSMQHYVIKFVSDLRQVGCFLRVLQFPSSIKLTATM